MLIIFFIRLKETRVVREMLLILILTVETVISYYYNNHVGTKIFMSLDD